MLILRVIILLSNFDRHLELMDRFETNYIRVLCYDFPNHYSGSYKCYEYNRLCTITQGEKIVSVNNKKNFKYDNSNLLLLTPHSKIHMTINQPTKAVVYELNYNLIKQINEKVSNEYSVDYKALSQNMYYFSNKSIEQKNVLNKITDEILKKDKGSEFLIDLYAQELVYYLIKDRGIQHILNTEINNPVNKAIRYMYNNFMNNISIKQLAYDMNMSEANFCLYFKLITSSTPNTFLTKIKLDKAKEMLKYANITEVAYNLGYSNISYFISIFKKEFGITPKQYKKSLLI